jgi:hypothetical protein
MIKGILKGVTKASALCVAALCVAAEPLVWERRPNRPAPAQFDTFHGETLDFRCTFAGFGALPFSEGGDVRLWYQTNGMGAAWWSVPATVASNVVSAAWPPSADPGADRVSFFFGAPSNAYAAAQVRFRNSPGAHPNDLEPPSVLDWQAELAAATNALWESSAAAFMPQSNAYTKSETDARIAELAPRPSLEPATNYTDSATNALRESITAELREKADVSRTAVVTNSITVPGRIEGGNWTFGSSLDGWPTDDLVRDAALTASATNGSIYWSAQTDYTPEGEDDLTVYRYAVAWYNPYTEIFQAAVWNDQTNQKPSAVAGLEFNSVDLIGDFRSELGLSWPESFATLNTPEPDTVAWQDFRLIPLIGTSTAYVPTQAVETVVYSRELAAATNGLISATFITTNNPAFVEAVTNCPVAIAASDAEALAEWGIYGGGGTIGALLAALAAAVVALKKKKMPLYPVGGSGNPVNATLDSGVLTVSPFAMAAYTPPASAAFSVAMGALPSDLESGKARDAALVIDCTSLTDGQGPTVTWDTHFHPRTDAETDFACVVGVRNIYWITEYAPNEFCVACWQDTTGGNAQ